VTTFRKIMVCRLKYLDTLAKELNVQYLSMDMTEAEQIAAGIFYSIKQNRHIRGYIVGMEGFGELPIAQQYLPHEDGIRENHWLDKMEELDKQKVLPIVGSNHLKPFTEKAVNRGHNITATFKLPISAKD
jgi:hypothetical protein